jgi:flagellar biosynthesis/type III secretory pathway protein FliH
LELGGIEFMEVLADRRIERGGTIVQTEYGEIDATIATQIENARALLAASLVGDRERDTDEHQAADDAV